MCFLVDCRVLWVVFVYMVDLGGGVKCDDKSGLKMLCGDLEQVLEYLDDMLDWK